jgi:carboxypeptidase family protein/tetratricopeptide repeat protein
MRRITVITSAALLLIALAADAQMRGTGRLQGNVFDKATGKPIAGATITVSLPNGNTQPIVTKTDARGHWAALGMTPGQWYIDIAAPGYNTTKGTASISELSQTPAIRTELEPQAVAPPPEATVPAAPSVPKVAVDAIKEGEQLLNAKPGDVITTSQTDATGASTSVQHTVTADELKGNAQKAVADFEKALPMIPEDTPALKDVKNQVYQVLAQAYYRAGDVKNAIATMEKLNVLDPATTNPPDAAHAVRDVLLANLYLENGQLDQGRALLDKLPPNAITDPTAYINIGILFLNKKNPADAIGYFTKAITMDPKRADSYYYRGLAEVQVKKNKEAKADFEQVVALAPDSSEAKDAKQLLASLK